MNNKIIEKYLDSFLPASYLEILDKSKLNNSSIKSIEKKKFILIKNLEKLDYEIQILSLKRQSLKNQVSFIKKNYFPKIYFKQYYKKNQSTLFSHIVIKYFLISKTIYFGKVDRLIDLFSLKGIQLSHNNFQEIIMTILYPKILDYLSNFKNKTEFIQSKITSKDLIAFVLDNEINNDKNLGDVSLLDYLRSLK